MPQIFTYSQYVIILDMFLVILGLIGAVLYARRKMLVCSGIIAAFLAVLIGAAEMHRVEQGTEVSNDATRGLVTAVRDDPRLLAPARRAMADGRLTVAEYRTLQKIEIGLAREDLRALRNGDDMSPTTGAATNAADDPA